MNSPEWNLWRLIRRLKPWRYYWRRYLTLVPVQFCFVCGRGFWAGWPALAWNPDVGIRLIAGYNDYCSGKCAKEDMEIVDSWGGHFD